MACGESAIMAAAKSAARRRAMSVPRTYVSGTSATPASSEGSRIQTVGSPNWAVIQASTKYAGGVTSGPLSTASSMPPNERWATSSNANNSSPNRLWSSCGSRSTSATAVIPSTAATLRSRHQPAARTPGKFAVGVTTARPTARTLPRPPPADTLHRDQRTGRHRASHVAVTSGSNERAIAAARQQQTRGGGSRQAFSAPSARGADCCLPYGARATACRCWRPRRS